jgi:hypothetical protein
MNFWQQRRSSPLEQKQDSVGVATNPDRWPRCGTSIMIMIINLTDELTEAKGTGQRQSLSAGRKERGADLGDIQVCHISMFLSPQSLKATFSALLFCWVS